MCWCCVGLLFIISWPSTSWCLWAAHPDQNNGYVGCLCMQLSASYNLCLLLRTYL